MMESISITRLILWIPKFQNSKFQIVVFESHKRFSPTIQFLLGSKNPEVCNRVSSRLYNVPCYRSTKKDGTRPLNLRETVLSYKLMVRVYVYFKLEDPKNSTKFCNKVCVFKNNFYNVNEVQGKYDPCEKIKS